MSKRIFSRPKKIDLKKSQRSLLSALISGEEPVAVGIIDNAINNAWQPSSIYIDMIGNSMVEIGSMWHKGQLIIAVEHRATQIALRLFDRIQRAYIDSHRSGLRAIIAAVQGENHSMGALTFADLLRIEGWNVDYLGADVPPISIAKMIADSKPNLIGLSVTTFENIPAAVKTIDAIRKTPNSPVTIVGGSAVKLKTSAQLITKADYVESDPLRTIKWLSTKFQLGISERTIDTILIDIGDRIQSFRKSRGLSQLQLASEAQIDRSYISALENGKQNISFATMKNISDALGIRISELLAED